MTEPAINPRAEAIEIALKAIFNTLSDSKQKEVLQHLEGMANGLASGVPGTAEAVLRLRTKFSGP
ncbi:hypothetical protein [Methylobacterium gossipiicola]|uniref:hypothetical protein n=1 Tax=Methylobacterium gossipiicola TaxID=582675 RepID=UPI001160D469|nr:hypothetical protein [Methylobacterium gossipiicola]